MDRFTSFDGVELAYQVTGEGPPVVLLHGFAADSERNWVRPGVAGAIESANRQTVLLDARGHGRSEKPHEPAAYAGGAMARDVVCLLEHLGLENVDVCGYSMGARTAMTLAANGDRVRTAVFGGVGRRLGSRAMAERAPTIGEGLLAADAGAIDDPVARAFREFAESTDADLAALSAFQRSGAFPRTDLSTIELPTLVIAGADDRLAGSPHELAERIPGAEVTVVSGDHLSAVFDSAFATAIVDFLARVDE
ncbi:MAG: alpha/beta hydrolase [Acidimicrobiales bacterium]